MIIKSRDRTKPVLLYLHGGMPDYFLAERYAAGLEECFTVCWWDQRRTGDSVPLYEAADGWSPVLAQLSPGTKLSPVNPADSGNFIKVRTPDGLVGYVSKSAAVNLA